MQEERKGKGLLIAILLVIILILISLVGFFIYNDYYLKEDSNESNTEIIAEEELSLTDAKVIDIEKKIDSIGSYCTANVTYFYEGESVYNSSINETIKQDSVINYLDLYSIYNETKVIDDFYGYELNNETIQKLDPTYKNLFGQGQKFVPGNSYKSDLPIVNVNGKYLLAASGCGTEYWALDPTQKVIKYEKEIKLYKKVGYVLFEEKNSSVLSIDSSGEKIFIRVDKYDENTDKYFTEQIKNNPDKFDTYVFTFKLDETGNYYFYSSEKA